MSDILKVSHSRIRTARRCWKKHDYKYNEGLRAKKKAAPLLRGTILHEMIDARVNKQNPYLVTEKYAKKYKALFREEREMYGETFIEDINRIFQGYERAYPDDKKLKVLHSEKEIEVELDDDIVLVAILDKIVHDGQRIWLMEHKSHRSIPDEEKRFSDIQTVIYVWAWNLTEWAHSNGEEIDGVMWDYLRTKPPTIPEPLKKGGLSIAQNQDTDYYTYVMAAKQNGVNLNDPHYKEYVANLKKRGSMDFFQRFTLPAPPKPLIKSVVRDLRETANQIKDFGADLKARNLTKDCSWECEFYKLCHAELRGHDVDFVKKTQYEVRDGEEGDETKHS
jgi:hypothetical protein